MQPNRDLPICVIIQMMDGREPILTDRTGSVCLRILKMEERKRRKRAWGVPVGDAEKSVNRRNKRQKKKSYLRQSVRLSQK